MASSQRAPSPAQSFVSTNSALPETNSYYRDSIDSSRQGQQSRRFHATNNLYRSPSGSSSMNRGARLSSPPAGTIDDGIAVGLSEDASTTVRPDQGFVPSRQSSHRPGSILPPAGFFAPKKPQQSGRSSIPLSMRSENASSAAPDVTPGSHKTFDHAEYFRHDAVPLNHQGRPKSSGALSTDTHSMHLWQNSASSNGHAANSVSQVDEQGRVARSSQLSLGKASHDALLASQIKSDQRWEAPAKGHENGFRTPKNSTPATFTDTKMGDRRYKKHRGGNRFFCFGLIMTSEDNPIPFILSVLAIVALPVLWFVFVAPFTWHNISPAPVIIFAYIWAVAIVSMGVTAWRDPGVLPRDLDPTPLCTAGEGSGFVPASDPLAIPVPRVIRVRHGTDLKVKWCDTCGTYRPPRSSHCRSCDNCVENIDHHCTFLNTCIGRRNYFSFIAFLIFSILSCFVAIAFSILHIYFLTRPLDYALPASGKFGQGKTFRQALQAAPVSAVLFFLAIGVVVPLTTLLGYHVRLIAINRTTVEQIRINATHIYSEKPSYDDQEAYTPPSHTCLEKICGKCGPCAHLGRPGYDPNPFAYRTVRRNIREALLRPMAAESWIARYAHEKLDVRRPNPAHCPPATLSSHEAQQ